MSSAAVSNEYDRKIVEQRFKYKGLKFWTKLAMRKHDWLLSRSCLDEGNVIHMEILK